MSIALSYGRSTLELQLPANVDATVIRKPRMPVLHDSQRAVMQALARPIGAPPLQQLAATASSACIAICDITRPVPNHLFLQPLISTLIAAGIPESGITVVVATGLHRPNEGAELQQLVGDPWVFQHARVVNHFARNDDDHVTLGTTRTRGTVVRIDRRFVEADVRIATGLVEPHFMAGWSGGRKVIAPGLAHAETITTFHSARFMADPFAANCNLSRNPLHEEQLEIVRMLGGALAVNTVIDEDRNLSMINFGEVISSHEAAVEFAGRYCQADVDRTFPTVVTSAAGYPLDATYYQTVKGMVGPLEILSPGGNLIVVSECSEGMGSAEFLASQQRLVRTGPQIFLEQILRKSHADIDEWQTQMQLKSMQVGNVHLVTSGLTAEERAATGVRVWDALAPCVEHCLSESTDHSMAVIPEGPYIVPQLRKSAPA
jgi:nickel-dependent lactate racemase